MIKEWDIYIAGFRQKRNAPIGMLNRWLKARQLSAPERCIQLYTWNDDWKEIAAFIKLVSVHPVRVRIRGYSWGGDGAVELCAELEKLGISVEHLILVDAVYRSNLLPTWIPLNPLSLLSIPKIKIPANVARVQWLYQRMNKPAGHVPVAMGSQTTIEPGIKLNLSHADMDEAEDFARLDDRLLGLPAQEAA